MTLSEHFTLDEMTLSQAAVRFGLDNEPGDRQIEHLRALCENVLEPLRDMVRRPIIVSSGYRSKAVNARVGGSPASQHCRGEAVDIVVPGMAPADLVDIIRAARLPFDQVIDEGRWTHVSHSNSSGNRGDVLVATFRNGKASYRRIT